jgi:hypothetical protein
MNSGLISSRAGAYSCQYDWQGLDIYINELRNLFYWYTYDLNGDRSWYWGLCSVDEDMFKIYTATGGTFDKPACVAKHIGFGSIDLDFNFFVYDTDEHGRGVLELEPIALSDHPLSGAWFDREKKGSGFSIQRWDDVRLTAYWFNWGHDGKQRWFWCNGTTDNMVIREVVGASFNYLGGEVLEVGSAELLDDGTFNYDLNAVGLSHVGSLDLERLF